MTEMTTATPPAVPVSATPLETDATQPTVRELLAELAALEDATRGPGACSDGPPPADLLAALAREEEIIAALHRRAEESGSL